MDRVVKGILIILWPALLTFGCVTTRMYEGEQLPNEQIATIKGSFKYYGLAGLGVKLTEVDGISICPSSVVEVLPGWHEIEVSVDRQVGGAADPFSAGIIYATKKFDYYTLGFCSLPGHKYLVKSSFWKKKDARVTVVDTRSGEIVASQSRKVWYWHKPDVSIEQLKQDSSECKAKGDEKSCMEEKGYSWTKF